MSKFDQFDAYPSRGLSASESVLLTVWPTLQRHHDDIVLVGGLAVHYLTREQSKSWPGAVTMDVDLGLSLAVDDDRYGSIMDDMRGLGFSYDGNAKDRLVREVDGLKMYLDFMTDSGMQATGTTRIGDVVTSSVPGLNRALAEREMVTVNRRDFYGTEKQMEVPVCGIGPLLVLKLNAFGGRVGRRHPKDAYDVLLCVTSYSGGAAKAIEAFKAEADFENPGHAYAVDALKNDFMDIEADGPTRAADFLRAYPEHSRRLREELVTAATFMLDEA